MEKTCKGPCGRTLPVGSFGKTGHGYTRNTCHSCLEEQRSPEKKLERAEKYSRWMKSDREKNPFKYVLIDSRGSDKKASRENDLDKPFVEEILSKPCGYCGEDKLRMTLDRMDNSVGHVKANVVPACIRCNYARGNMPYEAWLFLVPGLKQARDSGAFGSWVGRL